jgi:hypothetical protein
MEPDGSFCYLQESATSPYSEPNESNPHLQSLPLWEMYFIASALFDIAKFAYIKSCYINCIWYVIVGDYGAEVIRRPVHNASVTDKRRTQNSHIENAEDSFRRVTN